MLNTKNLLRSSLWLGIRSIFHHLAMFALIVIIARVGPGRLGIFYTIMHVFFTTTATTNMLLNTLYMRHLRKFIRPKESKKFSKVASTSLSTAILYSLFTILIFIIITKIMFVSGRMDRWLPVVGSLLLAIPAQIISSHIGRILLLKGRHKDAVILQKILTSILRVILATIAILILHKGLVGIVLSQTIAITISAVMSFVVLKRILPIVKFEKFIPQGQLFPKGTALLIAISNIAYRSVDLIIVAVLLGFRNLGHYVSALYLPYIIYSIPLSLFSMFYPVISAKKNKGQDITTVSRMITKWTLVVIIPLLYFVIHFGDEIILKFLGHHYEVSPQIILFLSVGFGLRAISSVANKVIFSHKYFVEGSLINLLFVSIFIVSSISNYKTGIYGIALAFLLSSLAETIVRVNIQYQKTKITIFDKDSLKVILFGGISVVISLTYGESSLVAYPIFLVLFLSLLVLTKTVRKKGLFYRV